MSIGDSIAVFIDAENLAVQAEQAGVPLRLEFILERLAEEGTVRYKKAYGDWGHPPLSRLVSVFTQNTIEMAMLMTDHAKNTADMQMAVDALEMALLRESAPSTIVIASGDRDFVPLAKKIRRYGIKVIGVGLQGSISRELANECDLYLYYDQILPDPRRETPEEVDSLNGSAYEGREDIDLPEPPEPAPWSAGVRETPTDAYRLLWRAANVLERKAQGASLSNLGQIMRQLDSTFDPGRYGFETFKQLVKAAESAGWVTMRQDVDELTVEAVADKTNQFEPWLHDAILFSSPDERLDDYRRVLAEKRVPLLPVDKRRALIGALWGAFRDISDGIMHPQAIRILQAQDVEKQPTPLAALRKLIITLTIAGCFEDLDARSYVDAYTRLRPTVDEAEALSRLDRTYIRGIRIDHPQAPLEAEPVALLLYGSDDPGSVERAKSVIAEVLSGR